MSRWKETNVRALPMHRLWRGVLAMASGRSPWGGEPGAGDRHPADPHAGDEDADAVLPGGPHHDGPARGEPADDHAGPPKDNPGGDKPRNPWLPPEDRPGKRAVGLDDIFRARGLGGRGLGGNDGGRGNDPRGNGPRRPNFSLRLPTRPDGKSWAPLIVLGVIGLWVLTTSSHELNSTEQGIVTTFGKYTRTIGPGFNPTLPWPIEDVAVTDVTSIRRESIPEGDAEKLMLTSDQNLVDLSYLVRWNIRDLKLYSFQLTDPDTAVRDVAEAAMRASVAEVRLNDVMGGNGRALIEQRVRARMQALLDAYRSGVLIQGVDIKKADPPEKVNDAFQQVSAAEQEANRDISRAQGFAQQVIARAQGDAAAFDKVYAQYRLAPEVTRRRMYYETMERVLANNDKVITQGNTTSYLPLPEVRRGSAPAGNPGDAGQSQGQGQQSQGQGAGR